MSISFAQLGSASRIPQSHLDGVSTVRGSGWVSNQHANQLSILNLDVDPSAIADGADPSQVRCLTFCGKNRRLGAL